MLLGYIFYGIALILVVYIVVDLAKTKKFSISDTIAILGIVVAILLALDIPFTNALGSSEEKVIFEENFDDDIVNGLIISQTDWETFNIDKTDKALRVNNISNTKWGYIEFIDQIIKDGSIEYSVNIISYDTSLKNCSGCIALHFRSTENSRYVFSIVPNQSLALNYQGDDSNNEWMPLTKAISAYNLNPDTWHQVKIIYDKNLITAYFDGIKIINANDDRLELGSINIGVAPNTIAQFDDLRILIQP